MVEGLVYARAGCTSPLILLALLSPPVHLSTYGHLLRGSVMISTSVGLFEERAVFNVSFSSLGSSTVNPSPPQASAVSYTHLRAHETDSYLVCRLLLEKNNV